MKIVILAIGKRHDPKLAESLLHYEKMLGRSFAPEWVLLDSGSTESTPGQHAKKLEGEQLLKHIKDDDSVIALDESGTQITSPEFAAKLQAYQNHAAKRVVFVIGGAFGLSEAIKLRADFTWSLSKLVFPHQLVRLVLLEQLYRASTILSGKQYHY